MILFSFIYSITILHILPDCTIPLVCHPSDEAVHQKCETMFTHPMAHFQSNLAISRGLNSHPICIESRGIQRCACARCQPRSVVPVVRRRDIKDTQDRSLSRDSLRRAMPFINVGIFSFARVRGESVRMCMGDRGKTGQGGNTAHSYLKVIFVSS